MATSRQLTDGYMAVSSRLVANAGNIAANSFRRLGSWRDEDVQRYISGLMPALDGIKRQSVSLTSSFHQAIAEGRDESFTVPNIPSSELTTAALRRGVPAELVYRRPFVDLWTALSKGKEMSAAIEAGAIRARSLASTEIQLAKRNASLFTRRANDNIVGFVRVLSGTENCALCFVASTQRYTRGDLLPIHPGCDCGELEIYGTQDPGQVIDEQRLNAVHESVEARFGFSDPSGRGIDYRKITIQEHGELGPILTIKGEEFTSQVDLSITKGLTRVVEPYTDNQLEAARLYGGGAYVYINRFLRDGDPLSDVLDRPGFNAINELDAAMSSSFLAEDATLLRGLYFNKSKATYNAMASLRPGDIFEDLAFLSTTKNSTVPDAFIGNVTLVIKAKAGTKGIDMNEAIGDMSKPIENEVLLPRGTKLKVLKTEMSEDDVLELTVEVVDDVL